MSKNHKTLPLGRGSQTARAIMLMRWLAQQDEWVSTATIALLYPPNTQRTMFRDLRLIQSTGAPLEWDEHKELGWRLRRAVAVRWMLGAA